MSVISRVKTWIIGDTLTASDLNAEFNNIINDYNGGITNANLASNAAIAYSKLSLGGNIVNADINAAAAIAYSKLNLGSSIVNADIAAGAAITASKIADTAITQTATQTMSAKTLTKPTVNGSIQGQTADSDGATITFDMSASNIHAVTLSGNRTLAVSNFSVGQSALIILTQDGVGTRTVSWFSTIKWQTSTVPVLTTTASKADAFVLYQYSSGQYYGFIAGQNM